MTFFIGTAGWSLPRQHLEHFPVSVSELRLSHLERYATQLGCVEINSSFYRTHRRATWERWAATTPDDFRFAVKAPKCVTHTAKLVNTGGALMDFFAGVHGLGEKLGLVLLQLPPKLAFDEGVAREFLNTLRELHSGRVVLEPRHVSWFTAAVDRLLCSFEIARAAADPPKGSELAARPGGWTGQCYWRLHGTPRTYYSNYDDEWLQAFAERLQPTEERLKEKDVWVIFDNTALGHAIANAVFLQTILKAKQGYRSQV